jgi:hypothetical protein
LVLFESKSSRTVPEIPKNYLLFIDLLRAEKVREDLGLREVIERLFLERDELIERFREGVLLEALRFREEVLEVVLRFREEVLPAVLRFRVAVLPEVLRFRVAVLPEVLRFRAAVLLETLRLRVTVVLRRLIVARFKPLREATELLPTLTRRVFRADALNLRQEPLFIPPPDNLLTVAHARCLATRAETPLFR